MFLHITISLMFLLGCFSLMENIVKTLMLFLCCCFFSLLESSSSNLELCSSGIGDLRKRNLKREDKDIEKPQLRNRRKKTKKTKEEVDSQRGQRLSLNRIVI